ncbi:hypothetical protein JCGZ_18863 [Jatropha curcas]|uniref:C2 domain-containing protein n=1 Tax=Jatropha curcas TaxID=180498 RepID=A0A067JYD4_JATCU|nr:protein SRC2 [Jatropha curcas]KDP27783.1 hypothetical protein JCGZ_18863 [Jatropha curcas]
MEQRTLEINLISAKDLKDVNLFSKMDVYAVVSISGDSQQPKQKIKTPVDHDGGTNPTWNFPAKFTILEAPAQQNRLILVINLRCERALGDKDIGEVNVPIKELLETMGDGKSMQFVSYQVRKPSGKPKGQLNFSYKFSEKAIVSGPEKVSEKANQPVTAYPAPPPAGIGSSSAPYGAPGPYPPPPPSDPVPPMANYSYPPPAYAGYPPPPAYAGYPPPLPQPYAGYPQQAHPPGHGYPPPPPPAGYGYPPVQAGYGYQPVQQPAKKNKFGMGLGAGLLGGAIGGLLIGDMVSDAASYDAGYDAGFDDAGGF